ncbi:hypothetical protein [Psychroserpens sp.]|uniref:hypothetical protein n=1 Tax=Psychroserpens sp. TaxID=2020870 RepID=UPI001B068875|nr:hypothetical protein [Psychroserpens sp.]MBO6608031.1 hypothetical protein [Psychroserpens sp.]MBO6632620.1 hypothetical protein [Psychroserpens sp.]MBO6655141.1 hypothetical protein [Psychroserpens sp.]MBO6683241.1 hypothetical protein [Psychroserpens sp.]MBO6751404.1 hypothetical protein [Psychroserpens sp.]
MNTYNKYLLTIIIVAILFTNCALDKAQDPFEISKQHIGLLTDSTQVKDLNMAFPQDSIVNAIKGDEFSGQDNDIHIYDKDGNELLVLTPSHALDSTAVIKSVRIMNDNYNTSKNISINSTFKDIKDNYKISSINNLINSVVISVNEINGSFTIDKKELPANLRFDMTLKIEAVQIPDHAKIKYFMIHW